jgi:hypothetical protein
MDREDTHARAELSRLPIAADPSLDPHRLVGRCCELALRAMFALSALALAGVALRLDRGPGPIALAAAVLLLCSLLAAYAATRPVVLPPLTHAEPVDAVGADTKLVEAAGLVLALRLLHTPVGRVKALPALREGAR